MRFGKWGEMAMRGGWDMAETVMVRYAGILNDRGDYV